MTFYHQNEIWGLLCSFIAPKATVVTLNGKFGVYIFLLWFGFLCF